MLALTQNRWKSVRKNNNHKTRGRRIISLRRCLSVVSTASRAKRDCFRDTNFHRRGCGPAAVSHIYAAAAAAATRSTSFLPAFVVLPTDYFIMLVFSAEKYDRKIIITKTPPTTSRFYRIRVHITHIHPRTHTYTHARAHE